MKKILILIAALLTFATWAQIRLAPGQSMVVSSYDVGSRVYCLNDGQTTGNVCYIEGFGQGFRIVDARNSTMSTHYGFNEALNSLQNFLARGVCARNMIDQCRIRPEGYGYGLYMGTHLSAIFPTPSSANETANYLIRLGACR